MKRKSRWTMVVACGLLLTACRASGPDAVPGPAALPEQQAAAHFVDSSPVHGATYALVPDKALINFDFTLAEPSSIEVTRNGPPVQVGTTAIGGLHNVSMSAPLLPGAGDGQYVVIYRACWTDGSCGEGRFAFIVDSAARSGYTDMTGAPEVALDIKSIKFQPARIVVSKGTRVTWTNHDGVVHFVNTDPHPSHNNLPELNSPELGRGNTYSFTFTQPGEWRYHCSAHQNMVGIVLVQ